MMNSLSILSHGRIWLLALAFVLTPMMYADDSVISRQLCRPTAPTILSPWQDGSFEHFEGSHFFRLFVPEAGFLLAEVTSLAGSDTPSLELLDPSCQPLEGSFSAHHAHHLRFFETSGFIYVRITPKDPTTKFTAGSYRFQSGFMPDHPEADKGEGEGPVEEERDEWDEATWDPTQADKGEGEGPVEEERDEWDELRLVVDSLCPQIAGDDHGETFACASSITLGTSITGHLKNGIIFDRDTLLFSLETRSVVAFQLESASPLQPELLDLAGGRFEMTSVAVGSGWLLVATLPPGDHALRLSALEGGEGPWRLLSADFPLEWLTTVEGLEP